MSALDFREIRIGVINALCSDEELLEELVLKGGNALALLHGIGSRTSLDLDFSMQGNFEDDLEGAKEKLRAALSEHFRAEGYVVFDLNFDRKPDKPKRADWFGYRLEFKILPQDRYDKLSDPSAKSREASVTGPGQKRVFSIDFSCHEYTQPKVEYELNDYPVFAYTPEMIAIEKLRALCQQMDEYEWQTARKRRPRDLYDIFEIFQEIDFVKSEYKDMARAIFEAKGVPFELLERLPDYRELHREQWSAVEDSVGQEIRDYDFYFDKVVELALEAKSLWDV